MAWQLSWQNFVSCACCSRCDSGFFNCDCGLCCSEHSNLRKVCEVMKVPYIGVVAKVQSSGTLSRVAVCIRQWKNSSCPPWVHIHASTPCGSGSPLRNFNQDSVTEKDQEWDEIINAIGGYFKHADSCSFELPERNAIWSRPETVNLLESFDMRHQALVRLCNTGCQNKNGIPIGKTFHFHQISTPNFQHVHATLMQNLIKSTILRQRFTTDSWQDTFWLQSSMLQRSEICVWKGAERNRNWRFVSCTCFACCFKQTLPKTNRNFTIFISVVQNFVVRCCKMRCATRNNLSSHHAYQTRNNLSSHHAYHEYDGGSTLCLTL